MVVKDVVGVDPGSGQASINSAGKCMQIMWFSMQAGRAEHYHTDGSMAQYGSLLFAVAFIQETERTNECWCRPLRRSDAITPASSRSTVRQTSKSAQMCRRRWCFRSEYTNSANWYTNTQAPMVHTDKERRVVSPGVWAAAVLRRWCVDLWAAA